MRQSKRSAKDKIRDLKRVLQDGLDAIHEHCIETITGMFILPGNGRDGSAPGTVLEITRQRTREITYSEYKETRIAEGRSESEIMRQVTLTQTVKEITETPKYVQQPLADQANRMPMSEDNAGKGAKRNRRRKVEGKEPIPPMMLDEAPKPAKKDGFDIDAFMENAIDASEIGKFNNRIDQRIIRPIRWR